MMHHKQTIALYLRLSKEDDPTEDESNSITSQRILLERFATENFTDYELLEYSDDGYSGTNMNRPGMSALRKAAEEGQLDCIIVKDFSRFSRDYIELGTYIEQIFPFLHIRFISVGDHYDSQDCQGMTTDLNTNFRSLLYDFYSKDLSVKVKSALAAKKEHGEYACANAPFGYRKDLTNRHQLHVVPQEGEIIRRIFNMAADGLSSMEIALLLNREQVKTPIQYKIEAGETKRSPKGDQFRWSGQGICRILENSFYTGDMVYGKYEQQTVGGRKVLKPKSSWLRYPEHHPAIVDRKLFASVQKDRGKERPKRVREKHPFTGYIICGACRKKMRIRYGRNPYFTCTDRYVTGNETCVTRINVAWLEELFRYFWEKEWYKGGCRQEAVIYYREKMQELIQEKEKATENLRGELRLLQTGQQEAYEKFVLGGRKNTKYLEGKKASSIQIQLLQEKILEAEVKNIGRCEHINQKYNTTSDGAALRLSVHSDKNVVVNPRVYSCEDTKFMEKFYRCSHNLIEIFLASMTISSRNEVVINWKFNSKCI
jgi:DNA invertase Pin-like site-specific DNA recombinase